MKEHIPWNPDVPFPAERAGYVSCVNCGCWRPRDAVAHTAPSRSSLCKDTDLCKRLDASHLELRTANS